MDIVAEAGLFNEAFYRHFRSKDDLIRKILDEGTRALRARVEKRMALVDDPDEQIRVYVTVLQQAAERAVADQILAVVWNARVTDDTARRIDAREVLALSLLAPVTVLGSRDPRRDALTICLTTLAWLDVYLWRREAPTPEGIEHLVHCCRRSITTEAIASRHVAADQLHRAPSPRRHL